MAWPGYVNGRVTAYGDYPVAGADVKLLAGGVPIVTVKSTPPEGFFFFPSQPGDYQIVAELAGYRIGPESVTVKSASVVRKNLDYR